MNRRRLSWILAALLTLCAAPSVGAVRAETGTDLCAIVWIANAQKRAEDRVITPRPQFGSAPKVLAPLLAEQRPLPTPGFDSLYQRPPPVF